MSLKTLSERSRSPPGRAPTPRPRLRVLPLFVASITCPSRSLGTIRRQTIAYRGDVFRRCGRYGSRIGSWQDQSASTAAAHLTALAAGIARLVGSPFVCGTLFMRCATALAGDFALLFGRHRRESPSFFTLCSHRAPSVFVCELDQNDSRPVVIKVCATQTGRPRGVTSS